MTRINLVTDPSLRSGTVSAYRPFGGSKILYDAEYAFYGTGALRLIKSEDRNSGVSLANPVSVVSGLPYAFSVYARIPVTIPMAPTVLLQVEVTWTDSVGSVVSQDTSAVLDVDTDSTWYRVGGVWTAPDGATQANVAINLPTDGIVGGYVLLDSFLVEQANHIGGYFEQLPIDQKMAVVNKALSAVPQVINGVKLGADIIFNDLTLNTVDEFGTVWIVTDLSGWWGQTAPDLPDIPRGTEEGSYDVQGRATARTLTLTGFFIPADGAGALTASLDRLVAACNLIRTGGWFMANEGPNKAVWVRLAAAPDIQTVNARGRTEFSVTLRAGDPIKYHWNDQDPDGYTVVDADSSDIIDAVYTNLHTNPDFVTTNGTVEVRRNLIVNPRTGTAPTGTWAVSEGSYGVGGAGTLSEVSVGGPIAGVPFRRKTWTTATTETAERVSFHFARGSAVANTLPAVTPGETYSYGYFWRASDSTRVNVHSSAIYFYDSSGVQLGTTIIDPYESIPGSGEWQYVSSKFTVPEGATQALPHHRLILKGAAPTGFYLDISGAIMEKAESVGPYFDGIYNTTPDLVPSWIGTVDASVSILTGTVVGGAPAPTPGQSIIYRGVDLDTGGFTERALILTTSPVRLPVTSFAPVNGTPYTILMDVKPLTRAVKVTPRVRGNTGATVLAPVGQWTRVRATITPTLGSIDQTGIVLNSGAGHRPGDYIDIKNVTLVSGRYLGDPFSGSSISDRENTYEWSGTPNASTSIRTVREDDRVFNIGTATVTGVFTFTGPAGAGTSVFNASTGERMVLDKPLRGRGIVASVDAVEATNNVATVYTTAAHHLRVGDEISFADMVLPFSGVSGTRKLLAVSDVFPYSVSFQFNTDDINKIPSGGQLSLSNNDVLVVDTYNRTVTYNGEETGHRYRLTTLTDWVHFAPGANVLQYFDNATKAPVYRKQLISNVATLTTRDPHYLREGEAVHVDLPVTRNILKKSLTSNKVTLVTTEPHGYAVGDVVNVESTESAVIVSKSRASNVVTLATEASHGVSIGDSITVSLPTSFAIKTKGASSTVVTITSQAAHGFSPGDSVVVALPTTATLAQKQISSNQAILTTSSAHGFVPGDNITVALSTVGSTTTKARSGGQVTLTTSASHNFAVGDIVTVNLPVSSTLSGNRVFSASTNLVTYTTASAHGFGVGDIINISLTPTTVTTTSKVASATACTLTLGTNHRIATGDIIRVTGETSRFDGTFTVTSSTSTTVSYNKSGAVVASTAGAGSVLNVSVADHYNGVGAVETIPSSTTFTVREWGLSSDATVSASGTVSNVTNETYNGDRVITSIPSSNRLSFNI